MKSIFKKSLSGFIPASSEAESLMKKIKLNELVTIDVKKPRNMLFHRKYFSMLKLFADNIDYKEPLTVDYLLDIVKIELKMYTVGTTLKGKQYPIIESVSFAKMDQIRFEKFYSKSLDVLLEILNQNTTKENRLTKLEVEENLISYI